MRKLTLALAATAPLALAGLGCAHEMHQERADIHHDRAREDAKDLHFGKAIKQQHESNVEQHKADESRW